MWIRPAVLRGVRDRVEFLGTEDSEQIDWQVKITRIVGAGAATGGVSLAGRDGLRAAGAQAGAEGPVHRGVPGAAGV